MELRKYGINEVLLQEFSEVLLKKPLVEVECFDTSEEPTAPVSYTFCRLFKRPKKIYNALIKMNIYLIKYVTVKPGYYTFVCKTTLGLVLTVDIKREDHVLHKRALEKTLIGLADQILELKAMNIINTRNKRSRLVERLGNNVKIDIPESVNIDDDLIDQIDGILNDIRETELLHDVEDKQA